MQRSQCSASSKGRRVVFSDHSTFSFYPTQKLRPSMRKTRRPQRQAFCFTQIKISDTSATGKSLLKSGIPDDIQLFLQSGYRRYYSFLFIQRRRSMNAKTILNKFRIGEIAYFLININPKSLCTHAMPLTSLSVHFLNFELT